MILYVLIAAFVGGGLLGAGGMNWWNDAAVARAEKAQAKAEAVVAAAAEEAEQEAANKIIDMQAAFNAGEAQTKVVTKIVYQKAQQYAATNAVLTNPQCFIPADGLQFINGQGPGVALGPAAAGSDGSVRAGGGGQGGQAGRGTIAGGSVSVAGANATDSGGMRQTTGATSGPNQVAGSNPRAVSTNPLKPK